MRRKIILFLGVVLSLGGITGCASLDVAPQGEEKISYRRFSDLPIPPGAKYMYRDSFVFENAAVRIAMFKYQISMPAPQVADYFRRQMKISGWYLENTVEAREELLSFHNERELCFITIVPKSSSSVIFIRLLPRANKSLDSSSSLPSESKSNED